MSTSRASTRRVLAAVATSVVAAAALAACTPEDSPSDGATSTTSPVLLTAHEAGGGKRVSLDETDRQAATQCGPDLHDLASKRESPEDLVRYDDGTRSIVLGVWPEPPSADSLLTGMRDQLDGPTCQGSTGSPRRSDWRTEPVTGLSDYAVAFRAVTWYTRDSQATVAPSPSPADGVTIRSTARAYGIVDDHVVMVRLDDATPTPPSADELRTLWDKQVAKVRANAS